MLKKVTEDLVIDQFLRSIGPWNEFIVIGGGYALIIYRLYLANNKGNPPVGTRDIDSLISRKLSRIFDKSIAEYLDDAGFEQSFKDYEHPATESYIKEMDGIEVEIEFLTDDSTRGAKNKNIAIVGAGVTAQQLTYIQMSLDNIQNFKTFSGTSGQVVSSGAWMFHKGLTFLKRSDKTKKYKDLYGIWYVATQLGEFSRKGIEELLLLSKQHSQWFKTFYKNLQKWVATATPNDWTNLESQDPYGDLKREMFVELVSELKSAVQE